MRKTKNEELNRLTPEEFKNSEKLEAVIVLDDVRSAMNVGSAFRTGDAFRVDKIYLCGITATPPHREINKTALGAQDTVEWEQIEDIELLVETLKKDGFIIASIEQADESTSLLEFEPSDNHKYAFIFGNEVYGVKDPIVDRSDVVIEIPQFGTKHSLNISVSIGVVLWDYFAKQKRLR